MFDPYSREYVENPFLMYKQLRDEAPVWRSEKHGFWAISRYEDVYKAHRDARIFCSSGGVTIEGIEKGQPLLILKDQPEHGTAKGFVTKIFSRARMEALDIFIRNRVLELLDGLFEQYGAHGEFDMVSQFSVLLPLDVISELLGIPQKHRQKVHHLANTILARGGPEEMQQAALASMEIMQLFVGLSVDRRENPRDDVISMLLAQEQEDEDGNLLQMSDHEIGYRFMEMALAGHETVAKAIPNGAMALQHNPGEWDKLVANPALAEQAIHEILRYDPPSHLQGRTATQDIELHGVTIPKGDRVMLLTGAAVRDERQFEDPDTFDISRETDPRSLYFGFGVHKCLGIHLAQRELAIVFEELATRFPGMSVDPSRTERALLTNVRGVKNLPMKLGAKA